MIVKLLKSFTVGVFAASAVLGVVAFDRWTPDTSSYDPAVEEWAGQYGIQIEWVDDVHSTQCGVPSYGCYLPGPGYVQLVKGVDEDRTWDVVRHEVAHSIVGPAYSEQVTEAYSDLFLGGDTRWGFTYSDDDVRIAISIEKGVSDG